MVISSSSTPQIVRSACRLFGSKGIAKSPSQTPNPATQDPDLTIPGKPTICGSEGIAKSPSYAPTPLHKTGL